MHKLKGYRLSSEADQDLDDIYEFSYGRFGILVAEAYLEKLHHLFEQLVIFPEEGILREELFQGLRSITSESHTVYYIVGATYIFIERVLHQSRDTPAYF